MSGAPLSQHNNQTGDSNSSTNLASTTSTVLSHCKAKLTAFKMGLFGKCNWSDPFILTWNIGTTVTLLLPLLIFTVARLTNQEEYNNGEQNGEQDYYDNNPYNNPENYDEYGNYVGPTHWWQFWKRSNNNYQNGEGGGNSGDEQNRTPWWCKYDALFFAGVTCLMLLYACYATRVW